MKKVVLGIGLAAFLLFGVASIQTIFASDNASIEIVKQDPVKDGKDKKDAKDGKKCCDSKKSSAKKGDCVKKSCCSKGSKKSSCSKGEKKSCSKSNPDKK